MSVVTAIFIACNLSEISSYGESGEERVPAIESINNGGALSTVGHLKKLSEYTGGSKHPQVLVYGGGFNHLPLDEFESDVKAAPWEEPGNVRIWIKREDDEVVTQVTLVDNWAEKLEETE